jgi:hypothetical protein
MTKFIQIFKLEQYFVQKPSYASFNPYKGRSDYSNMKFLHFSFSEGPGFPAWIRIWIPNPDPDPLIQSGSGTEHTEPLEKIPSSLLHSI